MSEAAHARLLAVAVGGNIATTTDTTSPFMAQWTRTGKATWKVSAPPQRDGDVVDDRHRREELACLIRSRDAGDEPAPVGKQHKGLAL